MLDRIKDFFKKLFNMSNSQKCLEETKDVEIDKNTFDLKEQVVTEIDSKEKEEILVKEFSDGKIREDDLSNEERKILIKYYLEEIEKTKKSINNYKEKIISIKKKIEKKNS